MVATQNVVNSDAAGFGRARLAACRAGGLFVFPVLIDLGVAHPLRLPYYVAVATVGSVAGNLCVYYPARKAGQAYYHATHTRVAPKIQRLIAKYPIACVFFPALAPFPVPIKPFVVTQGVLQVPIATFVIGTLAGRACRFFAEAFLGVRYGPTAKHLVFAQKWPALLVGMVLTLSLLFLGWLRSLRGGQAAQAK
jgi:membrane protein YqaA with SNARE-associated domain